MPPLCGGAVLLEYAFNSPTLRAINVPPPAPPISASPSRPIPLPLNSPAAAGPALPADPAAHPLVQPTLAADPSLVVKQTIKGRCTELLSKLKRMPPRFWHALLVFSVLM
eukprot:1074165-Prorocentrum_minimum.AAC.2